MDEYINLCTYKDGGQSNCVALQGFITSPALVCPRSLHQHERRGDDRDTRNGCSLEQRGKLASGRKTAVALSAGTTRSEAPVPARCPDPLVIPGEYDRSGRDDRNEQRTRSGSSVAARPLLVAPG